MMLALCASAACGTEEHAADDVLVTQSALTINESTLGFENPTVDWKAAANSGTVSRSTTHTAGSYAMGLAGPSYRYVTSRKLSSLGNIAGSVTMDIRLPTQQPNPQWYGNVQLFVSIPSRSVSNQWAATRELTGLATGSWVSLSATLDPAVVTKLRQTYTDLTISIALNVPQGAGTYLFDNMRFPPAGETPVTRVLNLISANNVYTNTDRQANRDLLRESLIALTVAESTQLMNTIRQQGNARRLVDALADIRSSVVNPASLRAQLYEIFETGRNVDYQIELLTYTDYNSANDGGLYAIGNSVFIYDYAAVTADTIIHESNHSFNHRHGLQNLSGLNEGNSITIFKSDKNLGETTFGTVLFYRDFSNQTIIIGDPNVYDAKGKDFMRFVMSTDRTKINWFDPVEVQGVFDACWVHLNRAVDFNEWLADAEEATTCGHNWISARRPL
jgi:hypothetical protein